MVRMKILHLLPGLAFGGAARQALILGRGLAQECDLRLCVLSQEGPWAEHLRSAGVITSSLGWARFMDPAPLWRLRRLLRSFRPDLVHVWRLSALRALAAAGFKYLGRTVASRVAPAGKPGLGAMDRWLLRRLKTIVADYEVAARDLEQLGLTNVCVIPPGVELSFPSTRFRNQESGEGRGEDAAGVDRRVATVPRRIVCLGNLENAKGFPVALRAADYLAYVFRDVHLYVIGDGSALPALLRFHSGCFHREHIHFLGARADAASWLASAAVCWVPSLEATGRHIALEAMARGVPVIASDLPCFRAMIRQGESGVLVPPSDATRLAQQTRRLFLDEISRRRLGEAARRWAGERFSAVQFLQRFREFYGLDAYTAVKVAGQVDPTSVRGALEHSGHRQAST
jgi:glycosyltransferase involved in cell wall biosynthesis